MDTKGGIDVVVIIATSMMRTDSLIEQALPSVYAQKGINPVGIYIIDDNENNTEFSNIVRRVKALRLNFFQHDFNAEMPQNYFHTAVMRNIRTKGKSGSGAWNTGAMHAYKTYGRGRKTYIALLDDDDRWHPNYLSSCVQAAIENDRPVSAVVSSFYRCTEGSEELITVTEDSLNAEQFYIGNPGWQGSNTFIELTAFWRAGGFDESMSSTHDRDLALRMLDVCMHEHSEILALPQPLVYHHVHTGERVTTCIRRKSEGLTSFYRKYQARMNDHVLSASLERASNLFAYSPVELKGAVSNRQPYFLSHFKYEAPIQITIGVVSSDHKSVLHQLQSLKNQVQLEQQFYGMCKYIVLTNGYNSEQIERVVAEFNDDAFSVDCLNIEEQRQLLSAFPYKHLFDGEDLHSKSIAFSRTLVQFYCYQLTKDHQDNSVVVILDDDLLFEALTISHGKAISCELNFLGKLSALYKNSTADILISSYSDAPPLPFYSSLRTQLVDVLFNLHIFKENRDVHQTVFNASIEHVMQSPDYYYDLSSSGYTHLEHPVQWDNVSNQADDYDNFKAFLDDIEHLAREANITRPLLFHPEQWPLFDLSDSYKRGGITIFIDHSMLLLVPNISPNIVIDGVKKRTRRSDFIASLAIEYIHKKKIKEVAFPLRHNRRLQGIPCKISADKLAQDILGLCFYRVFKMKLAEPNTSDKHLVKHFQHHARETLAKLKINNMRILELLKQIKYQLARDNNSGCDKQEQFKDELTNAYKAIEHLEETFAKRKFNQQLKNVRKNMYSFDVIAEVNRINSIYR